MVVNEIMKLKDKNKKAQDISSSKKQSMAYISLLHAHEALPEPKIKNMMAATMLRIFKGIHNFCMMFCIKSIFPSSGSSCSLSFVSVID